MKDVLYRGKKDGAGLVLRLAVSLYVEPNYQPGNLIFVGQPCWGIVFVNLTVLFSGKSRLRYRRQVTDDSAIRRRSLTLGAMNWRLPTLELVERLRFADAVLTHHCTGRECR